MAGTDEHQTTDRDRFERWAYDELEKGLGFPEPTPETRAALGCWAKTPGDLTECWCGYYVVDGLGGCPQCVKP